MDIDGKVIIFDIENITIGNIYLPSGTDAISRSKRESLLSETIPRMLINRQMSGLIGGDWNCILNKEDATNYPEQKLSPSLVRLVKTFSFQDSYRILYPSRKCFSRYYETKFGGGASRLDRNYQYGQIMINETKYESIAFSDHMAHILKIDIPECIMKCKSPKSRPLFKTKPEVVLDEVFQSRLKGAMEQWLDVKKKLGVPVINWWEGLVKPGIRKIAISRSKEMNRNKRGELDLLLLRQAYLARKLQRGHSSKLAELKSVKILINQWYENENEKVKLQCRIFDINNSEKVNIYHHALHQKHIRKTSILKLETDQGLLQGHSACAEFLENSAKDLLIKPSNLDRTAQDMLLTHVKKVFTSEDNELLEKSPSLNEVKEVIENSNLHAAPGSDGITSYLYKVCWKILGCHLTEVMQVIFEGNNLSNSQRTSLMVFGTKPKKAASIQPKDKRKICLLNSDFKTATGILAKRLKLVSTHTLSPNQFVAGSNRKIHHCVNLARDAIVAANKSNGTCGILDADFMAAFDYLDMNWVFMVLEKKGLCQNVINKVRNIYKDNKTTVVVNNVLGSSFPNLRWSLRQGDVPSM